MKSSFVIVLSCYNDLYSWWSDVVMVHTNDSGTCRLWLYVFKPNPRDDSKRILVSYPNSWDNSFVFARRTNAFQCHATSGFSLLQPSVVLVNSPAPAAKSANNDDRLRPMASRPNGKNHMESLEMNSDLMVIQLYWYWEFHIFHGSWEGHEYNGYIVGYIMNT